MNKRGTPETLVSFDKMSKERHIEISRKGGINAGINYRKRKAKALTYEACVELLKRFLGSPINEMFKSELADICGEDQETYFGALLSSSIITSIKKGDMLSLAKILEIIKEFEEKNKPGNTKGFESLLEAIKYVREAEPKTKKLSD